MLTSKEVLDELEVIAATKGKKEVNYGFVTPCALSKFHSFKFWAHRIKSPL